MYSWGHTRRFNAFSNYSVRHYGQRLQKVAIDAGFSCPNRDGTIGTDGCYYCDNKAFNPSYCMPEKSITQQLSEGTVFLTRRYKKVTQYLAYFQAYTNTYASTEQLIEKYAEALRFPGVVGIVIGTRPDCVSPELLDSILKVTASKLLFIEFGVESCYDETLKKINRGHNFNQVVEALHMTAEKNIHTGIHLIFGLPGETPLMILQQVPKLAKLPFQSLKIHQLQIIKGTLMERLYREQPSLFANFTLVDYIALIVSFLERLPPKILIDRLAGEAPPRYHTQLSLKNRESWAGIRNDRILQLIEKKMQEKDTWQGKLFNSDI